MNRSSPIEVPVLRRPHGEAELVIDGGHFQRVVLGGILKAKTSLDITTADFKAMLVPTTLIDLLAHPDFKKFDLSSLKHVTSAGSVVPSSVIREFKKKTGVDIMNCYGLAEASGLSTWVPEGYTPEHVEKTVGLAMPHCELAILDVMTAAPLPAGEEGEICTKEKFPGSQHMKGYYKKPELTAHGDTLSIKC